jgi:hypothetical protein
MFLAEMILELFGELLLEGLVLGLTKTASNLLRVILFWKRQLVTLRLRPSS